MNSGNNRGKSTFSSIHQTAIPDSGSCIRRGHPDLPASRGGFHPPAPDPAHNETTHSTPPDDLPCPLSARRQADVALTTHRRRPAPSYGSSTSGIVQGKPPCPRAPGSVQYCAGRPAGRLVVAKQKRERHSQSVPLRRHL